MYASMESWIIHLSTNSTVAANLFLLQSYIIYGGGGIENNFDVINIDKLIGRVHSVLYSYAFNQVVLSTVST